MATPAVTVVVAFIVAGHPLHSSRMLLVALAGIAMMGGATFLGLTWASGKRVNVGVRIAVAVLPPLAFASLATIAHPGAAVGRDPLGGCLSTGLVLAAVPMAVMFLSWRRTDPYSPRVTGALIGGWAGLTGAVGLTLTCPSNDLLHIALGHGGAVAGGALLGWLLGRKLLSP